MLLKTVNRTVYASKISPLTLVRTLAVNASPATKNLADELFAPAKAVMSLLEAVADVHPAIKVRRPFACPYISNHSFCKSGSCCGREGVFVSILNAITSV